MTRFIDNGIQVPAIPKLYLWPDGGWRAEKPEEAEPFAFQPEHDGSLPLRNAVFQALGAASSCWENMSGTGVFDSRRAKMIGETLMAEIEKVKQELIEAIRLTQEYVQHPARPGWTWYDALKKHAPDVLDAMSEASKPSSLIDNAPTPPKEPEAEDSASNMQGMPDPYTEAKRRRDTYVPTPPEDPEPEKSLREKRRMKLRIGIECLFEEFEFEKHRKLINRLVEQLDIDLASLDRVHFDSKREALSECIGDWMEDADAPDDLHERLRAILFGKDA